jgi:hypothetical protein
LAFSHADGQRPIAGGRIRSQSKSPGKIVLATPSRSQIDQGFVNSTRGSDDPVTVQIYCSIVMGFIRGENPQVF